ncbi:FAD-dependent oxidoreductase [Nocardia sp. R6R-6]|uniref:FAD-dependent oxidoreductase n=1 Tax=Nocardia sp. R6R-6 TaxID=3459303 RepID=UPI00403E0A7A
MSGVVIAGAGVASVAAVRSLRQVGYAGPITLCTLEAHPPYDRPPLSKQFLAGAVTVEQIRLLGPEELGKLAVEIRIGTGAVGLDTGNRSLELFDGTMLFYDALLIATGADARQLPLGRDLRGVHYLRTINDAETLAASLAGARRVVIIGAGFIGLEVAATARSAGAEVTVLEAASAPLTRVLGDDAGWAIADLHAGQGVSIRCNTRVLDILGSAGNANRVVVESGESVEEIPADVVVIGVGAGPAVEWLSGCAVAVEDGIVCDERGRTSVPRVYAAGDVSRWRNTATGAHTRVEQWQAAGEQGAIAGVNMAFDLGVDGASDVAWDSVPYFWSDQYTHKVQFCGAASATYLTRSTKRGWVACYADDDGERLRGVLAIDGPVAVARGRKLVRAGIGWPEAVEWLESL